MPITTEDIEGRIAKLERKIEELQELSNKQAMYLAHFRELVATLIEISKESSEE